MTRMWIARFSRQDTASAMVEFAVVTPLLIVLAFGLIDFGRAFYVYNALNSVARDSARFAGNLSCGVTDAQVPAKVQTRVAESFTQYLGSTATQPTPTVQVFPDSIRVRITNYQYQPWTPILAQAKGMRFTVSAVFRRETPPPCT